MTSSGQPITQDNIPAAVSRNPATGEVLARYPFQSAGRGRGAAGGGGWRVPSQWRKQPVPPSVPASLPSSRT